MNVLHIASSTLYDSETSAGVALNIMKENYARDTWHYTNSDGVVPDLHHGIFYKGMGGGESKLLCFIVVAMSRITSTSMHALSPRNRKSFD